MFTKLYYTFFLITDKCTYARMPENQPAICKPVDRKSLDDIPN